MASKCRKVFDMTCELGERFYTSGQGRHERLLLGEPGESIFLLCKLGERGFLVGKFRE